MLTRLSHIWLLLRWWPWLLTRPLYRHWLREMRDFCGRVPAMLKNPLPEAMQSLTPTENQVSGLSETEIRDLADLSALLARRSPLGLCLRRSLVRYHYLRQVNVPVVVQFGAKLQGARARRNLTGHAWLTLNGQPYHELGENWQGFTVMYRYPESRLEN